HQTGGVAVMAHVGGFLFGFAAATLIEKSGYEARSLAPSVQEETTWTQHPGIETARAALERGDNPGAAQAYRTVLAEQPLDRAAAAPAAGPAGAVRVLACKLVQLAEDALHVELSPGKTRRVEFNRLVGVAAGVVSNAEGSAILTDFVLSWGGSGETPSALRI